MRVERLTHRGLVIHLERMAAAPAISTLAADDRGWIQSPSWDIVWMFSALWGGALLLGASLVTPLMTVVVLVFVFDRMASALHNWSTTYLVFFSSLLAEERPRHPWIYYVVPALIVVGSFALGLYTSGYQRYTPGSGFTADLWPWGLYLALFWVGHFWHFGQQDFGVLSIYRIRANQTASIDRRVDRIYTGVMMFLVQPVVYLCLVTTNAFSEMVHTTVPVSAEVGRTLAGGAAAFGALLSVAVAGFELSKPKRSLPKLLYIFVIFLHPVLIYGAVQAKSETVAFLYLFSYLWSHWLIAVGLAARINSRYYQTRGDSPSTAVLRHVAIMGFIIGLVYLVVEDNKQYLLFSTDGFRYKEILAAIPPEQTLVVGLVLGYFLAEQLIHYYADRRLFRFRDPGLRQKVGPLLFGGPGAPR